MNLLNPKALRSFLLLLFSIGILGLVLTHHYATRYQHAEWQQKLERQASQVAQEVDYELAKFAQIPNLLSHDPRLLSALEKKSTAENLNQLLVTWLQQSLADTIYVHDRTGLVIASSNYEQEDTFVGANFNYRPYFKNALLGQPAQYVGLGARSNKRGYFFSSPLWANEKVIGVITVKVNLELLEHRLSQTTTDILVTDKHNVVFMSNLSDWRYRALFPLSPSAITELSKTRQYGDTVPDYDSELTAQSDKTEFADNQLLLSKNHLAYATHLFEKGFRVIALINHSTVFAAVLQADMVYLFLYALFALITLGWFQMLVNKERLAHLNAALEEKVMQRTLVLSEANQQLKQIVHQYEQSQNELKQTQQELTQAAKLALLGELSASINHEINQPLAALKTYTENSQRLLTMERYAMVADNLAKMLTLNDTICEVIARLKVFTRKTSHGPRNEVAILHDAVHHAASILSNKLIKQGVTLKIPSIDHAIKLAIHGVELEQVLINLFHNAAQAMEKHCVEPQISIAVQCHDNYCDILVSDNGPGMTDDQLTKVFDPFFTTKPEGLGLGLTISKRILESYHGSLHARRNQGNDAQPANGMTFIIILPIANQHNLTPELENDHA